MPYKDIEKRREHDRGYSKAYYILYRGDRVVSNAERYYRLQRESKCATCGIELLDGEGVYCVNCRYVKDYGIIKGVL